MNDDQVRAFIAAALRIHPAGSETYRLALVAEELMVQRDARSEDFYTVKATTRAEVVEEIARALEATIDDYPEDVFPADSGSRTAIGGTAMRHAYGNAARIAREHGPEQS